MLLCGLLAAIAGAAVIVLLPLAAFLRAAIAVAWLACCFREWRSSRRGHARTRAVRLCGDGGIEVRLVGEGWQPAALAPGSVVLPGIAWLRIAAPGGLCHGELVTGNCRKNKDWRRLQVIWRHVGARI